MGRLTNTLGRVRVAAPCEEDWDEMRGDERVRFCSRCSLNVYNLSAMTRREAERLVLGAEGRLCVRFYRRADGTMLTQNCPTGLAKLKRRVSRVAGATAAAALGLFAGIASSPDAKQLPRFEAAVTTTLPRPAEATEFVANGRMDATAFEEEPAAEAFTLTEGAMAVDPPAFILGLFAPLALISGLVTLLTWPLFLLRGEGGEESRRAGLKIWSNEWSQSDESAALPREGSAVESDQ